ncbi:hypothetical protein STEG23_020851, partial [Scotinomys teguina]
MTVTPLGRDQDCSLKNREPDVRLSWFLDPGGWSKTAAVGLYFIFPGICTLSLVKSSFFNGQKRDQLSRVPVGRAILNSPFGVATAYILVPKPSTKPTELQQFTYNSNHNDALSSTVATVVNLFIHRQSGLLVGTCFYSHLKPQNGIAMDNLQKKTYNRP